MTDTEKKIAEIREALAKATPGPWVAVDEIATVYSANADAVIEYSADEREEDIRLIANAPEWLRFLLSQLDREREESRKLREERDKLIEVLRWYADEDTYEIKRRVLGNFALISLDQGQRARDILKEIGVTVE